ncbi:GM12891 [Drosophila sechellia]|uniref:GM12891 n=1 Tax=Drosophila sechellia TaxID=7238 RepID=B4HYM8_DROSE|nr:GM12891 [Drosophila sechellia]
MTGDGQMVMVEDGALGSAAGAQRERQHLNTQDPGPAQHSTYTLIACEVTLADGEGNCVLTALSGT